MLFYVDSRTLIQQSHARRLGEVQSRVCTHLRRLGGRDCLAKTDLMSLLYFYNSMTQPAVHDAVRGQGSQTGYNLRPRTRANTRYRDYVTVVDTPSAPQPTKERDSTAGSRTNRQSSPLLKNLLLFALIFLLASPSMAKKSNVRSSCYRSLAQS